MRSQQVYLALVHIPNRFALCRVTSIALQRLHKANSRPEDTINDVLRDIDRYKSRRPRSPQSVVSVEPIVEQPVKLMEESSSQLQTPPSASSDLVFVGY